MNSRQVTAVGEIVAQMMDGGAQWKQGMYAGELSSLHLCLALAEDQVFESPSLRNATDVVALHVSAWDRSGWKNTRCSKDDPHADRCISRPMLLVPSSLAMHAGEFAHQAELRPLEPDSY